MNIYFWPKRMVAFVAVAFFFYGFSLRSQTLQFDTPISYNVGTNAQLIVSGDVNNDGKLDLLVFAPPTLEEFFGTPPFRGWWLKVFTNTGSGTFVLANNCAITNWARSMCVGQFDGDTNLDVVMLSQGSSLNFLHGRGDATFSQSNIALPSDYSYLTAGDFNGDGRIDIGVSANEVRVLFGGGNGNFTPGSPFFSSQANGNVLTADFDGDGKLDMADVAGFSSIRVMMGVGDGTFTNVANYPDPASGYYDGLAAGDLNGDQKPDLVMCKSGAHSMSVRLNNGNGTFGANADFQLPQGRQVSGQPFVGLADFNLDGKMDVIVNADMLMVFPGNGNGTLGSPYTNFTMKGNFYAGNQIAVGDFDGDGRPDIAYLKGASNCVTVVRNITPMSTVSSVSCLSNSIALDINVVPSHSYVVEASTNLALTNGWTTVTNFAGGTNAFHFLDAIEADAPNRYYRVRMVQ